MRLQAESTRLIESHGFRQDEVGERPGSQVLFEAPKRYHRKKLFRALSTVFLFLMHGAPILLQTPRRSAPVGFRWSIQIPSVGRGSRG